MTDLLPALSDVLGRIDGDTVVWPALTLGGHEVTLPPACVKQFHGGYFVVIDTFPTYAVQDAVLAIAGALDALDSGADAYEANESNSETGSADSVDLRGDADPVDDALSDASGRPDDHGDGAN